MDKSPSIITVCEYVWRTLSKYYLNFTHSFISCVYKSDFLQANLQMHIMIETYDRQTCHMEQRSLEFDNKKEKYILVHLFICAFVYWCICVFVHLCCYDVEF